MSKDPELAIGPGKDNYGEGWPDPEPLSEEELEELRKAGAKIKENPKLVAELQKLQHDHPDRVKLREALGGNIRRITADDMNTRINR